MLLLLLNGLALEAFLVRVDYGVPFLSIDEGNNLQYDGLHFTLGYRF